MKTKPYKIRTLLLLFVMFIVSGVPLFSQEQLKLTLLHQDWREENPLSLEEGKMLAERERTLRRIAGPDFEQVEADEETLKAFAEFLWSDRTKNVNFSVHIDKMTMEENAIAGYTWRKCGNDFDVNFQVNTNQFEQVIDTQSIHPINKTGEIRVSICFGKSAEDALVQTFRRWLVSSMTYTACLSYYQLEQGPGDTCLVKFRVGLDPSSARLCDRKIIMIRGNVAVFLVSHYKDFGCMDLACRLDAFLVEQFEKAQKDEVKAEE